MKKLFFILSMGAILLQLNSCSKNDKPLSPEDGGNGFPGNYTAKSLFIKQGTEGITKFDLSNGIVTDIIPYWTDSGWDISWDGTKGVKEVKRSYGDIRYIIFNTQDGSTIKEILYEPSGGGGLPYFSPDGTKLALRPTLDEGLVILDMNGNVLKHITGYGNAHQFKFLDPITWEPSGSILFKKDGGLWRTTPDFARATKVRDIPFSDWIGNAAASPDGKMIALSAGNHIWLMNADGSDFHAVTSSTQGEYMPCFSPDSKYIAMKANSRAPMGGDAAGNALHICIIPADGQVYKVWPGEDNRVIHPMVKDHRDSRGLGKTIVGDFVWR